MNKNTSVSTASIAALLFAGVMTATSAYADKPESPGKGKGKHKENRDQVEHSHGGGYFGERQQIVVREYYTEEFRGGHCPPGLAKKNNGCMPPGQAKKWQKGRPLPRDVVYYDVPPRLVVQLGTPPSGHKYVRVASDILLIAVGTSMVVDAINDLGRL